MAPWGQPVLAINRKELSQGLVSPSPAVFTEGQLLLAEAKRSPSMKTV